MGDANAAYAASKKTIYLSEAFLVTASSGSLVSALLEEYGHYIDAYINNTDSPGDEGAIFSSLVLGESLSAESLQILKAEDDSATITVDARLLEVEQSITTSFISVDDITVGESDAYADFLVRLDAPNTSVVTVNYQTFNWTADYYSDYVRQSGYLTFAAGETVKTVRVTLINDTALENSENFGLELYTPSTNAALARNLATATIIDNDLPIITIAATDATASETAKGVTANPGTFTLTRTGLTTTALTVNYTLGGTATNATDYTSIPVTATFAVGSATATVQVSPIDDTLSEGSETAILTLAAGTGCSIVTLNKATVTIADNDSKPVINLSANQTIVEGLTNPQNVSYTVSLSNPSSQTITVTYATENGTALAGSDYTNTTGTLTFNPGINTQIVNIPILNDNLNEPNETFTLKLTNPTNATLGTSSFTTTITDTLTSSISRLLPVNVENLTLTGTAAINGTGNTANNLITGNSANNILTGGGGKDTLTGGVGNDRFSYTTLSNSLLGTYDLITVGSLILRVQKELM